MSARVEIYRDAYRGRPARLDLSTEKPHVLGHKGKWRWRFVSSNGRILADGSQGYSRRIDALNGCATVINAEWRPIADPQNYDGVVGMMWRAYDSADPDEWGCDHTLPVHDLTREAS